MRQSFLLPDGSKTLSAKKYCSSWKKMAKPIAKATNSHLFAFDPGFSFCSLDGPFVSFHLNVYEASRISAALSKKA